MNKDHILAKIKRTAKNNNGAPLGMDLFREETGIRREDWEGRFWSKWSDALNEAEFEPNEFGKPKFDEKWLLEKIASFVSEIGYFPTRAELKLRKRHETDFPNVTTIRNRLGTKENFAQNVSKFCETRVEWNDVMQICSKALAASATNDATSLEADEQNRIDGHVYLLKHGNEYKIGRSTDASRRYKEIRTQMPYVTKEVHVIETDDPVGIEAYWHNRFREKRLNG